MPYGQATHGPWCNSRTFPTTCKHCQQRIFYFTCDHGCRVLFNELGPPWPEHRCLGYLVARYGQDAIEQGMATMMMLPGIEVGRQIDRDYAAKIQEQIAAPFQPEISRCDPYDGVESHEEGIVRELIKHVDVYKRFKIPTGSAFGASLLGPLAKGDYAQVTIHTGALAEEDSYSFTFFVSHKLLDRHAVIKGDIITCYLRGLTIPGHGVVWICEDLIGVFS